MPTDARETLERLVKQGQSKGYVAQYGLSEHYPDLPITPEHAQLLIESGIAPDVAAARFYISVLDGRFFVHDMYITTWTKRAPCLLIPIWDTNGEPAQCQIRPDSPRRDKGRVIKYESLPESNLKLDVPPAVAAQLRDPRIPLIITEGARKADAAVSQGAACISLLGVWGFRGRNAKGGKTALVDWENVALNERIVKIVFDSDAVTKSQVAAALQRLRAFLESRGASVQICYLPAGDDGSKVGLDDYLAKHSIKELDTLVKEESEEKPSDLSYRIVDGRYVVSKGDNVEPLCNFTAKIDMEELRDDGLLTEAFYHISGKTSDGRPLPSAVVPVEMYQLMYWVEEQWRTKVHVGAGRSVREHLAAAIKAHSQNAPVKHTFAHTGWRTVDGTRVYLYHGGHIPENVESDIDVKLDGPLANIVLEPTSKDAPPAKEVIDAFLKLAPTEISVPLLSGVVTSILGEFLTIDFGLHLEGTTGTFKSELAALCQGFFGREFNARRFPANWSSTAYSLELQAHSAKDAIFVIDDYAPQPGRYASEALAQKAEIIFRGAGNQAGRGRLSADIKVRPEYFARGLVFSTGEDALSGQSLNARVLTLHLGTGMVDTRVLTNLQQYRDRGFFTQITRQFIEWLLEHLPSNLREQANDFRDGILTNHNLHKRNATAVGKLLAGWHTFCDFLEYPELKDVGVEAFNKVLTVQSTIQVEEDIASRCIDLLRASLQSGKTYLEVLDDDGDNERRTMYGYRLIDGSKLLLGTRIGFVDHNGNECLDPVSVHDYVWRSIGRSNQTLRAALYAAGWLHTSGKSTSYTVSMRVHGAVVKVYRLAKPIYDSLPKQEDLNLDRDDLLKDLKKYGY